MFIVNTLAIIQADALATAVDAGAGAGLCKIYSGTAPADADTALSGNTLLADITLNDPAFGSGAVDGAPGGVLTLDVSTVPEDTSADATGTATFARITDSDANVVMQLTVSVTAGGGELQINSISIQSGASVQITAGTFTVPES